MKSFLRHIALTVQSLLNQTDTSAKNKGKALEFARPGHYPIFIIGPPRSGSTLLYQLMLKHIRIAYISNLMSLIPFRMISIAKYTRKFHDIIEIKDSYYGYITGLFSPSEAGAVYRKWFDRQLSSRESILVRNTIILLSHIFSGPFVSKNLMNCVRLENIYRIFPKARFIFIKRTPLFNAKSILDARRSIMGTTREWWSVPLPGYEKTFGFDSEQQVLWQIFKTEEIIRKFLDDHSKEHLEITYENLCERPEKTIRQIIRYFDLEIKNNDFDTLKARNTPPLSSSEEWEKLKMYYMDMRLG